MNIAHLIPTPLLIGVLLSVVIPAISAAVSRLRWDSSITGIITALLAAATGFLTEWANAGADFVWKTAALTALGSWLVAAVAQARVLSGTELESWLLTLGSGLKAAGGEPDPTVGIDPDTGGATADPLVTGTGSTAQYVAAHNGPESMPAVSLPVAELAPPAPAPVAAAEPAPAQP